MRSCLVMGTLAERPTCTLPRPTLQEETVRPLSFSQERMWLLDQIDPGAATYNVFHTVDISGSLAPALLARSLDGCNHGLGRTELYLGHSRESSAAGAASRHRSRTR
jgi:hypothetical protein